jgi:hypothetical protein
MRNYIIASIAAVFALALPVTVSAAAKKYEGTVANGGTLEFSIKKTNHGKKLVKWIWRDIPADCDSGPEEVSGEISFKAKVKHNKFELDAIQSTPQDPVTARMTAEGHVNGDNVSGEIRVHGSDVALDEGGTADCDTGTEDWSASKV